MLHKLERLADYVQGNLDAPEIEIAGASLRGSPTLWYYQVQPGPKLTAAYRATPADPSVTEKRLGDLSDAIKRLIENIFPICEQLAWVHLRQRLADRAEPIMSEKKKVLISYRKGGHERQRFVEAIAHRLGREGFLPWYDEWEIKAGDAIARELAAGLQGVYGIVIVLTADYPGERWAREELETIISKRIEDNIRVIPIIYEACERPELLRSLRYVDCISHSEDQIERQFANLIDALNEIELNPYR